MQYDVVFAGFGGQGVLLIGKMLAYAGMRDGKEVSWLPSYGPEMRGGTCNCTVVMSDRTVGSPVVQHPRSAVVLNLPSLDKFEPMLKPGAVLVINTSLINRPASRDDLRIVEVPANEIAVELGNPRGANMVALGALIGATGLVPLGVIEEIARETFAGKPKVIESNLEALRRGQAIGEEVAAAATVTTEAR